MELNNKRKNYIKIDRKNGCNDIFILLDEVNSKLEGNIDNLMNIRILNLCWNKV